MALTFIPIQSATVTDPAGGGGIAFTSIPQTYTDLVLTISSRNTVNTASSGHYYQIEFNQSGGRKQRYFQGSGSGSPGTGTTTSFTNYQTPSNYTASSFSSFEIYIPRYTSSYYKSFLSIGVTENNVSTDAYQALYAQIWENTAAITRIDIYNDGGNFAQYTNMTLYGIS